MDMKLRHFAGVLFLLIVVGMFIHVYTLTSNSESFVDSGRCGVNLQRCSGERIRCMNGYCKSDIPYKMSPISDLPIIPPTKYIYA